MDGKAKVRQRDLNAKLLVNDLKEEPDRGRRACS
jgi:hypothetical protein